ncbi:MAG: hypothetical protein ACT4PU_05900 [Planctomycetota bacterium]
MRVLRRQGVVVGLIALLGLASAQSSLPDETSVVVTRQGLFLVLPGQPAAHVLPASAFGQSELVNPSVTWLWETDRFLVTSRAGGGGTGGLWRAELTAFGSATLEDLGGFAPPAVGADFADADYSMGLDTAFVLNRTDGRLLALKDPAHASGALLSVWATVPPQDCYGLAVNGARWPFGLVLAMRTGDPILRRTKEGTESLYTLGLFDQVTANPVTGAWYFMSRTTGLIGYVSSPDSQFAVDFNAFGSCFKLVSHPEDVDFNPVLGRVVALGGDGIACGFGGLATGDNHIVRLPLSAGGGGPSNVPVLLTQLGESEIEGTHADLAIVFTHGPDVTFLGNPGTSGSGTQPLFAPGNPGSALRLGQPSDLGLMQGVPGATGFLVVGLVPLFVPYQGQVLGPQPTVLFPALVDSSGEATVSFTTPSLLDLLSVRVYAQWWLDDTSTPAGGDFVSSQVGIFTIGAP